MHEYFPKRQLLERQTLEVCSHSHGCCSNATKLPNSDIPISHKKQSSYPSAAFAKEAIIKFNFVKRKRGSPSPSPSPPSAKGRLSLHDMPIAAQQKSVAHNYEPKILDDDDRDFYDLTSEIFRFATNQREFKSPEKIPKRHLPARKLLRFAKQPVRVPEQNTISDKARIIQNLYYKNRTYFYSNRVDIKALLQGVYYQNMQIEQLKDFLLPVFKKISSKADYFDKIFQEAKDFSETVRSYVVQKIEKFIVSDSTSDFAGGSYKFLPISRASKDYIKITELLYQHYKHIEQINVEVEQLTHIYLNNYLSENRPTDFDIFNFHARIFVTAVYKDKLIKDFLTFLTFTFRKSAFYSENYEELCAKVCEIHDNFELDIKGDVQFSISNYLRSYTGGAKHESCLQAEYLNSVDGGAEHEDSTAELAEDVDEPPTKKNKKKKKKNRNKNKKAEDHSNKKDGEETALPPENDSSKNSQEKHEDDLIVKADLLLLDRMMSKIDSMFGVEVGRKVSVPFSKEDSRFFASKLIK